MLEEIFELGTLFWVFIEHLGDQSCELKTISKRGRGLDCGYGTLFYLGFGREGLSTTAELIEDDTKRKDVRRFFRVLFFEKNLGGTI